VLSATLVIVACMHTNATMLSTTARPAVDEVALIDSHGDDALTSYHQMIESMRTQAAKVGANGLILSTDSDAGTVAKVARPHRHERRPQGQIGSARERRERLMARTIHVHSMNVRRT
jgi:hypothetical protein